MAEQIGKNLWRLDVPLEGSPLKNLNSYLITGEESLLIDTGFRQQSCLEAIERELDNIGVDRSQMDIFCTHLHSDHVGLAPELIAPNRRIFISSMDGPRLPDYGDGDVWEDMYREYVENGFSEAEIAVLRQCNPAQNAAPKPCRQYAWLEDGQQLRYGGHTLECVLTPGHTPGHMCLFDREEGILFSGDHVLFHITPNICRWTGVEDSLGDYLASLDRVNALPVRQLLPAHRAVLGELSQRTAELKHHHRVRLDSALEIVGQSPGLTAYDIAGRMAWSIRCRSWAEFPVTQKFFAVGEALAHLDYLEVRGLLRRVQKDQYVVYVRSDADGSEGHSEQM